MVEGYRNAESHQPCEVIAPSFHDRILPVIWFRYLLEASSLEPIRRRPHRMKRRGRGVEEAQKVESCLSGWTSEGGLYGWKYHRRGARCKGDQNEAG